MNLGREPIPDEAVLVRGGGFRDLGAVQRQAEAARLHPSLQVYGISTQAFVGAPAEAVARTTLPNPRVSWARVAVLRAAGYEVLATGREPHATLVLTDPLDDDSLRTLRDIFVSGVPNPDLNPHGTRQAPLAELTVDFNTGLLDGLVMGLLRESPDTARGDTVLGHDDDGNRALLVVDHVDSDAGLIYATPDWDTWVPDDGDGQGRAEAAETDPSRPTFEQPEP